MTKTKKIKMASKITRIIPEQQQQQQQKEFINNRFIISFLAIPSTFNSWNIFVFV